MLIIKDLSVNRNNLYNTKSRSFQPGYYNPADHRDILTKKAWY